MELEIANTLFGGKNFIVYLLLCFSQVFCIFFFYILYKHLPDFVKALQDISKETALMREVVKNMEHNLKSLRDEVSEVEEVSANNSRRLTALEAKRR